MAFALTAVRAYGREFDEPLTKRFRQYLVIEGTATAADVDLDLGDATGTFATDIGTSEVAKVFKSAIQDINTRAYNYLAAYGLGLTGKGDAGASVIALDSASTIGGGASETLTVTGLQTTDTILGATIVQQGANAAYVRQAAKACATAAQYPVVFSADPGAGLQVRVLVSRKGAAAAGSYSVTFGTDYTKVPNILFSAGEGPATFKICLEWDLQDDQRPVSVEQVA